MPTTRSLPPAIERWPLCAGPTSVSSRLSPSAHRTNSRTVHGSAFPGALPTRRFSTHHGRFFRSSSSRNKPTAATTREFTPGRPLIYRGLVPSFWSAAERPHPIEVPLHPVNAHRDAVDEREGLRVFGEHGRKHACDNVY